MKKPVPDPPTLELTRVLTCPVPFGPTDFHGNPMFIAREGICAEDALVHVSQILNSVQAFAHDSAEYLCLNDQAMALGIAQQAEMAKALVDAVLAGVTRSGSGRPG
ncbi:MULTISPECIES: DUF6124 family protein [unclassified Pseudomonas]|uniref:DUF6124 family protein n=1 Tax=unclassified Pseudomonas TaxID=196821 RepID=UPI000BA2C0C1|nr:MULTISPECIES: DUF3077 domain-containing protein [unclassified Pseudomonas]MCU1730659.1 DUF3077 domain-containing protein [Pseudomonas sp. 20P_3.2_Bac4]MCU1742198.1 DUF3077 domain-containing protein [Pseudomonas sp. 20P_3.2_Bac5]